MKRAISHFLSYKGFPRGRMDITAYHDPRRLAALTSMQVERLALVPVKLCDVGPKGGFASHGLARDCRTLTEDVTRFGLRLSCVVIISNSSDFCAAGVYDAVNDAGIPLVVVHNDDVKDVLVQTGRNDTCVPGRTFVHITELMSGLPEARFQQTGGVAALIVQSGACAMPASTFRPAGDTLMSTSL